MFSQEKLHSFKRENIKHYKRPRAKKQKIHAENDFQKDFGFC